MSNNVISIPNFMTSLDQEIVDQISFDSRKIIACGVDPKQNILYMISANLKVKFISSTKKLIPLQAKPEDRGQLISVYFKNFDKKFFIDSELALEHAKDCMENAEMFVNNIKLCDVES